jgi:hypothetical protein
LNAARNFFKHADQDPEGILEFDESQNELVLLDAVLVLSQLDSDGLEEANVFVGWITTGHPELRPAVSNNVIGDYCARNNVLASDFERFRELCDERILVDRPR